MRLRQLELVSYGAFESLAIQVGPGLTVVHGPNESGKSTTAHALADVLWGLRPRQHPYAFRVSPSRLLLRAECDDPGAPDDPARQITFTVDSRGHHGPDGQELSVWWQSGQVRTREAWSTAFGLDLPRLREGGRSVLDDGGDLARLLFQARTGIDVAASTHRLTEQAETLYKKHRGARKVKLRELAAEVDSRAELTAQAVSSATHVQAAREEVERLTEAREAADRRFIDREAEHAAAQEDRRAWEPAVELVAVRREQDRLCAQGRVLSSEDLQAAVEARRQITELTRRLAQTDERLDTLRTRLGSLNVEPLALALADTVEHLQGQQELQRHRLEQITQVRAKISTIREQIRTLATDVDPRILNTPIDSYEELQAAATALLIPSDVSDRLDRHAQDLLALTEQIQTEEQEIFEARGRRAGLEPARSVGQDPAGDYRDACASRDRAWQSIRDPWLVGELPEGESRTRLARLFDEALRAADDAVDRLAANERLIGRTLEIDAQLAARSDHVEQLGLRRDEAAGSWSDLLALAGAPPAVDPTSWQLRAGKLAELAQLIQAEKSLSAELTHAERASEEFAAEVNAVGERLELPAAGTWTVLSDAVTRVKQATNDNTLAEDLRNQREKTLRERDELRAELVGYEAVADRVRAGDDTATGSQGGEGETLDTVIERSRHLEEEQRKEQEFLQQIRRAARPGNDPEELAARVAPRDSAELIDREERAAHARDEALADRDETRAELDRAHVRLRELERRGDAAVLYARQMEAVEELHAQIDEYVRTKVMIAVLDRLSNAETPDHDTALLEHARQLARRLTAGRVSGLTVLDQGGTVGLRVQGPELSEGKPTELSEGTADQVFLALRLAGIRQLQSRSVDAGHGALPVLFDDILVAHDDARTVLALEVLSEEARDQQILLLTHHQAVAEAARAVGATVTHLPVPSTV